MMALMMEMTVITMMKTTTWAVDRNMCTRHQHDEHHHQNCQQKHTYALVINISTSTRASFFFFRSCKHSQGMFYKPVSIDRNREIACDVSISALLKVKLVSLFVHMYQEKLHNYRSVKFETYVFMKSLPWCAALMNSSESYLGVASFPSWLACCPWWWWERRWTPAAQWFPEIFSRPSPAAAKRRPEQ